jgi:nicotinamidase-related amidase
VSLAAAREARRPIVHVVRLYLHDGQNVDPCRRARVESGWHPLAPGTPGSEIAPALLPAPGLRLDPARLLAGEVQPFGPGEVALYKPRWGAFYGTALDDHLRSAGVDTIVVGGCNYPNCPRATLFEASERDYRVVLLADACSGLDPRGQAEMTAIGVELRTAAAYAAALG